MTQSAPRQVGASPLPDRDPAGGATCLLAFATALALVRFYRLGEWGLWIDEAYTLADYHHSLGAEQLFNPLGYLAIGAALRLFGGVPDELSLRFLPAVAGMACVPLTYWAFRPAAGARRAALAALLIALSPWHVYWSQSARFYTLVQLTALVGSGLLVRGLWCPGVARDRRLALVAAGALVTALSASFHPSGAFLLCGFVAGAWAARLLEPRASESARPGAWLLAGCAALGLAVLLTYGTGVLAHQARQKPVASAAAGVAHLVQTCGYFFTPIWVAGALFGAFEALRRRSAFWIFAAFVAAVSFAVPALLATRVQMTAQYAFVLAPWVALLAVAPLAAAPRPGQGRFLELGYALLLVLPTLAGLVLYFTARGGERPAWRAAYHYVADQRRPGELVLGMGDAIGEFYLGRGATDLKRPAAIQPLSEWFPDGPRHWTRHERRIWVVVRPQWLEGFSPRDRRTIETWLREECRLVQRFASDVEGRDLDVLVYLRE